jgi:ABC-2 type transport system ATP-binding protein
MRQILSLIRGLLHDPEVLLLDEPTRSLSPEAAKQVCLLIKEMAHTRRKTILMSSHNLQEATLLSDRMAIIQSGRLVAVGTPDDLKAQIGLSQDVPFDQVYEKFIEKGTMA